jgi:hypothetical protein
MNLDNENQIKQFKDKGILAIKQNYPYKGSAIRIHIKGVFFCTAEVEAIYDLLNHDLALLLYKYLGQSGFKNIKEWQQNLGTVDRIRDPGYLVIIRRVP